MALRAGYIGIKKSLLGVINSLSSAKIIKSLGDGLNLTSAGKLNLTSATASKIGGVKVGAGLEMDNGVLNVTIKGGFDYSTGDPVYTGSNWIDGNPIYAKTFTNVNLPNKAYTLSLDLGVEAVDVIGLETHYGVAGGDNVINNCNYMKINKVSGQNTTVNPTNHVGAVTAATVTIYFTIASEE